MNEYNKRFENFCTQIRSSAKGKTPLELLSELDRAFEEASLTGNEVDPALADAYIAVAQEMRELSPRPLRRGACRTLFGAARQSVPSRSQQRRRSAQRPSSPVPKGARYTGRRHGCFSCSDDVSLWPKGHRLHSQVHG